jgi:hypothetical protein
MTAPLNEIKHQTGTAVGFGGAVPVRPIKLLKWQPYHNPARTMAGFLSVELASGMIVRDLRLMIGPQGRRWLAMPAQQQLVRDGQPRLVNGRSVWNDLVDFRERATRDRFQAPILELLRRLHPEAFEGELP